MTTDNPTQADDTPPVEGGTTGDPGGLRDRRDLTVAVAVAVVGAYHSDVAPSSPLR
jgi:hypothetical protein